MSEPAKGTIDSSAIFRAALGNIMASGMCEGSRRYPQRMNHQSTSL